MIIFGLLLLTCAILLTYIDHLMKKFSDRTFSIGHEIKEQIENNCINSKSIEAKKIFDEILTKKELEYYECNNHIILTNEHILICNYKDEVIGVIDSNNEISYYNILQLDKINLLKRKRIQKVVECKL